ncbi:acetate--CoA ligase family protein [Embleya sp. NPDC008237]|uniref:acetate--CoA ligase family protein n=1 Tax=Embleya sp. NPDC008237 TaxID=3363978 RepID=UPI0036E081E7
MRLVLKACDGASVAVIGNAGGAGVLAADACVDAGLAVPRFGPAVEADLRVLLPAGAACANPVDTTATVDGETLRRCVDLVVANGHVDAVFLALAPTALGDPLGDLLAGPAVRERPVMVIAPERAAAVELLPAEGGTVPVYNDARTAAVALAHAYERSMWLTRPRGKVPRLVDVGRGAARALVADHLACEPEGGWLQPLACARLLGAYGIEVSPWRKAFDADEALALARELAPLGADGAVVLKAYGPHIAHKSDVGGVRLRPVGDDAVREAFTDLTHRIGALMDSVVIQLMAASGVELIAGVTQDEVPGLLVLFGLGGVTTDVLGDHGARLTPLTDCWPTTRSPTPPPGCSRPGRAVRPGSCRSSARWAAWSWPSPCLTTHLVGRPGEPGADLAAGCGRVRTDRCECRPGPTERTTRRPGTRPRLHRTPAHLSHRDAALRVATLTTRFDRPRDWLRAGQAMERARLLATVHGLRMSVLHQAVEWPDTRANLRDPQTGPGFVRMVLRMGYGPPGVPTPRRPVTETFDPADPWGK